jgi:hypothetical protein
MWLPDLYTRAGASGGTFCSGATQYSNKTSVENFETRTCKIDSSVYTSSLINVLSNVPGTIFTIFFIDKIGRNVITGMFFKT